MVELSHSESWFLVQVPLSLKEVTCCIRKGVCPKLLLCIRKVPFYISACPSLCNNGVHNAKSSYYKDRNLQIHYSKTLNCQIWVDLRRSSGLRSVSRTSLFGCSAMSLMSRTYVTDELDLTAAALGDEDL